MTTLLPAFLMGLAGSLHCIGMCSPLVMTVSGSGRHALARNLQYNFGRLVTYGMLGSIFSFVGKGLHLAGFQQGTSIAFGVVLLAIGITNTSVSLPAFLRIPVSKFTVTLKTVFSRMLNTRNAISVVGLGMINGLLPCGMTLIALGYCITLPTTTDGLLSMLVFGLGTLPGMVGFTALAKLAVARLGLGYGKLKTTLIIGCAVLLIGRGVLVHSHTSDQANTDIVVCTPDLETATISK